MVTLTCGQCSAAETVQGYATAAGKILAHELTHPGHHVEAH